MSRNITSKLTAEDVNRRVLYRPIPLAPNAMSGRLVSSARGKQPAAMIHFDGEDKPRCVYLSQLEWEDD